MQDRDLFAYKRLSQSQASREVLAEAMRGVMESATEARIPLRRSWSCQNQLENATMLVSLAGCVG